MSTILIKSDPDFKRELPNVQQTVLNISEFFTDTIQGEGINAGIPAMFIRTQDCTLDCTFCDSSAVWRYGNPYTIEELLQLFNDPKYLSPLRRQELHLVLTGGSPLRQQFEFEEFFDEFASAFGFIPYIEIENECTLRPSRKMIDLVRCWNNSPKLISSGNSLNSMRKESTIAYLASLDNAWFKFVITSPADWQEIEDGFIAKKLIRMDQIILMPEGDTRERLMETREMTIDMAVKYGVRYSDRLHIIAWNKRTGV